MGKRGRLPEFPLSLPFNLSEAQRYKLETLAHKRNDTMAGTLRWLIDEEWERKFPGIGVTNPQRTRG